MTKQVKHVFSLGNNLFIQLFNWIFLSSLIDYQPKQVTLTQHFKMLFGFGLLEQPSSTTMMQSFWLSPHVGFSAAFMWLVIIHTVLWIKSTFPVTPALILGLAL